MKTPKPIRKQRKKVQRILDLIKAYNTEVQRWHLTHQMPPKPQGLFIEEGGIISAPDYGRPQRSKANVPQPMFKGQEQTGDRLITQGNTLS